MIGVWTLFNTSPSTTFAIIAGVAIGLSLYAGYKMWLDIIKEEDLLRERDDLEGSGDQ